MNLVLTYPLSSGRHVAVTCRAVDGKAVTLAELTEAIQIAAQAQGPKPDGRAGPRRFMTRANLEAVSLALERIVKKQAGSQVRCRELATRLRHYVPHLTIKMLFEILPRLVVKHYGHGVSNDIPHRGKNVRGYRGIAFKSKSH